MKQLSLLRHAKSSWDDPVERDFDRPLNPRGQRAACRMGEWMKAEEVAFDHVSASPAVRVKQTIEGVEAGLGRGLDPAFDNRIYMASPEALLDIVRETRAEAGHLLLIGHNPGLEELLLLLSAEDGSRLKDEASAKYPTAAFASLSFDVDDWSEIAEGGGQLLRFVRPRDLDPALGPDS